MPYIIKERKENSVVERQESHYEEIQKGKISQMHWKWKMKSVLLVFGSKPIWKLAGECYSYLDGNVSEF